MALVDGRVSVTDLALWLANYPRQASAVATPVGLSVDTVCYDIAQQVASTVRHWRAFFWRSPHDSWVFQPAIERTVVVENPPWRHGHSGGLHATPSANIAAVAGQIVNRLGVEITFKHPYSEDAVLATDRIGIMTLAIGHHESLVLSARSEAGRERLVMAAMDLMERLLRDSESLEIPGTAAEIYLPEINRLEQQALIPDSLAGLEEMGMDRARFEDASGHDALRAGA